MSEFRQGKITYSFSGKVWKYAGGAGWYFVSLPSELAVEIRENLKWQEEGWGRMKVLAMVKQIEWDTAIWFDSRLNTYLLPLKAEIRKKGSIVEADEVQITLFL